MNGEGAGGPPEWARDETETEFTEILRTLRRAVPAVDAAIFIDEDGESIDYACGCEPFEIKVLGAHMLGMQSQLESSKRAREHTGFPYGVEIGCGEVEVWVRRISPDYSLVLRIHGDFERGHLRSLVVRTCMAFRAVVGLETPPWEPPVVPIDVKVREAVGWDYAPVSFREHGERVAVADVLGRWTEGGVRKDTVCFRVRTEEGRELTLVHDHASGGWQIR